MNLIVHGRSDMFEQITPSRLAQNKHECVWKELDFQLYKIYWLQKVDLQLENQHSFIENISQYFIEKMMILQSQELIEQIEQQQYMLQIDQQEWRQFIEENINYLQSNIIKMKQKLQDTYQQIQKLVDQSEMSYQDKQLYNQIQLYITQNIQEHSHLDIKVPFRVVLHTFYQNLTQQPKLQFLLICCLSINLVFGKNRNTTMTKILEFHKLNQLDSPIQIEQFLEKGSIIDIQQQTTIIDKFYF